MAQLRFHCLHCVQVCVWFVDSEQGSKALWEGQAAELCNLPSIGQCQVGALAMWSLSRSGFAPIGAHISFQITLMLLTALHTFAKEP